MLQLSRSALLERQQSPSRERSDSSARPPRAAIAARTFLHLARVDGITTTSPAASVGVPCYLTIHKQFDVRSQHLSLRQPRQRRGELRLREDLALIFHDAAQLVRSQPVRAFPA